MKILTKYATKGCSRSKTFYREMSEKLRRVGKMTSQRETADLNFEFTANMADVHFERLQLNVSRVSYVWQEWFSGNLLIVYQSFVWSSIDRISDWQYFDRSAPLILKVWIFYMESYKPSSGYRNFTIPSWDGRRQSLHNRKLGYL